ncbi:FAD:protein FMN transferase [Sporolactobacillus kofuensis]|uniref:FAD:protein FMN transferase n=1 Tax=Sporolactobacillus kofuensis TaxID=269672 RepID=A0ABW1WJN7_9BACL|nr:FAD:protein FMN transferase [Sporolactobacillus kofuensis]MCO7176525.1 FAD:protein FMN transferase [Sporolactobacillus kofuensis]
MDTTVSIKVVSDQDEQLIDEIIKEAVHNFYQIERACNRFDPNSELMHLCHRAGEEVSVSPILFQAINFAVETAIETGGAFDPTIGRVMEQRGFNRNYLSGEKLCSTFADDSDVTYKDITLFDRQRIILLKKPMVIDLNAVVKGMAVDLAVKSMRNAGLDHFIVNAGGDIYASGRNEQNEPWKIGIRNPADRNASVGYVRISDGAICTSGDYERPSMLSPGESHLLNPGMNASPRELSSCTVIAPFTMLADAFSTAASVMGRDQGMKKMEEMNLDCIMITHLSECSFTKNFKERLSWND